MEILGLGDDRRSRRDPCRGGGHGYAGRIVANRAAQLLCSCGSFRHFLSDQCPANRRWLILQQTNIAIRPVYTVTLEAGYFVTPNVTIALSSGVPPIEHLKATGFTHEPLYGTNLLGSTRGGAVMFLLQYHLTQFGALQPYAGIGPGYVLNLGNISDGILTNFSFDQNFVLALQAGTDWMLTPNWGVFVDGKKLFFSTNSQGFAFPGNVPERTHVTIDPWVVTAGITFKY